MAFGFLKRKDPVCGMKEEKGKGIKENGNWFCSASCQKEYNDKIKQHHKETKKVKDCCR